MLLLTAIRTIIAVTNYCYIIPWQLQVIDCESVVVDWFAEVEEELDDLAYVLFGTPLYGQFSLETQNLFYSILGRSDNKS